MLLIALLFAALGVAIGSSLQDMQGFQLIMNFLVLPIFFLSGALFPLVGSKTPAENRHRNRSALVRNRRHAFRASRAPRLWSRSPISLVLVALGSILMVFGAYRFSKIEV